MDTKKKQLKNEMPEEDGYGKDVQKTPLNMNLTGEFCNGVSNKYCFSSM